MSDDDLSRYLSGDDSPDEGETPPTFVESATVTNIAPGAGKNGSALVTVAWRGGSYTIKYFKHYTPVLNEEVVIVHHNNIPYIFGSPWGEPT